METKRYVVTGGCGFIGSHLVEHLLQQGAQVFVIDNLATGRKSNLDAVASNPNLTVVKKDIAEPSDDWSFMKGADGLFHLAALADIVPSIEEPLKYYQTNVTGTLLMLEAV